MTKAELVQLMGWRFGDRDDLEDRIELELDYVQDYVLESKEWLPWFLTTEEVNVTLTAEERQLPLPEDFLAEIEESALWLELQDGSTVELEKMDFDVAARKYPGVGQPIVFCRVGEFFQFFPIPDYNYTVFLRYFGKDERIRDALARPKWLKYASDVVMAELGKIIADKHIKDAQAAAGFSADAQAGWQRLYAKHTAMQEINQARSLGGTT